MKSTSWPTASSCAPISRRVSPTAWRRHSRWPTASPSPRTPTRASGGVEERRGGLGPMGITPFPLPAHQTGRADFPHPASRPASPQSTRRWARMDPTQSDHTEFPEHDPIGETPGAARRHLVAPDQEMTNSLVDRVVDGPVSRHSRPMVEVVRPTAQHAVQLIAHLGPGGVVAGTEHPADLRLEPGNAPLGRARPQVPVAILAKAMRAEL